jgi:hypothetical protein
MPSADSKPRHEFCIQNREDKLDVTDALVYLDAEGDTDVPSTIQSSPQPEVRPAEASTWPWSGGVTERTSGRGVETE